MIRTGWQVTRLREVLVLLVDCVRTPAKRDVTDAAIAEAVLVLRATDDGAKCEHVVVQDVGWDYCVRCSWRRMVDPPPTADELRRERAEIYGGVE